MTAAADPARSKAAELATARTEWRKSWTVVATSLLGFSISSVHITTTGLFLQPIERETGWARSEVSAGLTIVAVVSVVLAPFVGILIDRLGSRPVGIFGTALYCAAIASLAATGGSIWYWWGGWLIVALGSVCVKPTVWTTAVASHFNTGRGLAIAVALCGAGTSQMFLPYLTNHLLADFGWRATYISFGLVAAVIALPLLYAYFTDARSLSPKRTAEASSRPAAAGISLREGFRSRAFVFLSISVLSATTGIIGLMVHFVPMVTGAGLSRPSAAAAVGFVGLFSIIGRLTCGFLLDRFDARLIAAVSFVWPALACVLLLNYSGSTTGALLIAAVIGLSLGAEVDVAAYLATRYFGLRNFGTLFGTIAGLISLGGGLGPLIASAAYDLTGGYAALQLAFVPLFLVNGVLVAALGPYPARFETRAAPASAS